MCQTSWWWDKTTSAHIPLTECSNAVVVSSKVLSIYSFVQMFHTFLSKPWNSSGVFEIYELQFQTCLMFTCSNTMQKRFNDGLKPYFSVNNHTLSWIRASWCRDAVYRHLITWNCNNEMGNKNLPSVVSQCLLLFSALFIIQCVYCTTPRSTVRLRSSDQTSWADWGSHKGPFKHRQCNISPCLKCHFYFWHHKAVFENNWEPVDSWKWSFSGVGRGVRCLGACQIKL